MTSSPLGSPASVAAILTDEDRPQHVEGAFLDNLPVLHTHPETDVPPHTKTAAEKVVLALVWEALSPQESLCDALEKVTQGGASDSCTRPLRQFVNRARESRQNANGETKRCAGLLNTQRIMPVLRPTPVPYESVDWKSSWCPFFVQIFPFPCGPCCIGPR